MPFYILPFKPFYASFCPLVLGAVINLRAKRRINHLETAGTTETTERIVDTQFRCCLSRLFFSKKRQRLLTITNS